MKKLLYLLLFASLGVSAQTVGIKIATPIIKNNPTDNTITGYANLLNGGLHTGPTYQSRDSLSTFFSTTLYNGMLFHVYGSGVDSTYVWNGTGWDVSIGTSAANIYNIDGTTTGDRLVTLATHSLTFNSNSNYNLILGQTDGSDPSGIGGLLLQSNTNPSLFQVSDVQFKVNYGNNLNGTTIYADALGVALVSASSGSSLQIGESFTTFYNNFYDLGINTTATDRNSVYTHADSSGISITHFKGNGITTTVKSITISGHGIPDYNGTPYTGYGIVIQDDQDNIGLVAATEPSYQGSTSSNLQYATVKYVDSVNTGGSVTTLYTGDGSITGNRTVTLGSNSLTFASTNTTYSQTEGGGTPNITIGASNPSGLVGSAIQFNNGGASLGVTLTTGGLFFSGFVFDTFGGVAFQDDNNSAGLYYTGNFSVNGFNNHGYRAILDAGWTLDQITGGQPLNYATAAALAANTYANGTGGNGATLTATANGTLSIDGSTPSVGETVLIKDEVTQSHNGPYTVTTVGSGSVKYKLTRNSANTIAYTLQAGSNFYIASGSTNAGKVYYQTTSGGITPGTTNLVYATTGGASGVTSVTGTTNRITSTGGTTPVIDISATFEALLGKVASPLSQFASTTSAQLAGVISDETGSGLLVYSTSPSLTTPSLGVATATSINGNIFTTGTYTLTGVAGKTLTFSNTLTMAGTDGSTLNVGTGGTLGTNAFNSTAYVPTSTTVNGKALSSNITLSLASSDFANQGTTTTVYHGNGSGNPSFSQIVNADITNTTIDLTTKVTGILPNANTTATATPAASVIPIWDANKNFSTNSLLNGYTTIATAAGTTTLVVGSTELQYFTGSTTQTVLLPVTSTLVLGQQFIINNQSTGNVTIQSSGANTVIVLNGGNSAMVTCILTSGTTAASWLVTAMGNATITGTGSDVKSSGATFTGTTTIGTTNISNLALGSTGNNNNLTLSGSSSPFGGTAAALYQLNGSSSMRYRVGAVGNTSTTITAGDSYAGNLFGGSNITTNTSGTSAILTNVGIGSTGTYTLGTGSTTTWATSFYIDGPPTIAGSGTLTNPVLAMYVKSGNSLFGGNVSLGLGGELKITEGSGGFAGQTILVSGTKAITISGVTTSSRALVQLVTPSGTSLTTSYQAVATSNTLTIQANVAAGTINVTDGSTVNYFIIN